MGEWGRVGRVIESVPAFWAGLIEATLGQKGVLVVCVCVVLLVFFCGILILMKWVVHLDKRRETSTVYLMMVSIPNVRSHEHVGNYLENVWDLFIWFYYPAPDEGDPRQFLKWEPGSYPESLVFECLAGGCRRCSLTKMVASDASHGDRINLQKLGWEAFGLSQKDGLESFRAEPKRFLDLEFASPQRGCPHKV